MNKPASELIALADRISGSLGPFNFITRAEHELVVTTLRTAADQSGSERGTLAIPPDDEVLDNGKLSRPPEVTAAIAERTARLKELQDRYKNPVNPLRPLATPPAQPAPAATHGKPDGAVREAVCCSAISPCEYQRTHRTGVCETCQKAAAIDRLDVKAETSPGDAEAQPSDHAPSNLLFYGLADAIGLSAKLRFNAGGTIKHEFDRNDIKQLRDVLRPKSEAKSQEPDAVAIKPLEWGEEPDRPSECPAWNATSLFGTTYRVFAAWNGSKNKWGYVYRDFHDSVDAAKAAAQADYEQRIRSALVHPTTKPEAPAVSVDAIRNAIRQFWIHDVNKPSWFRDDQNEKLVSRLAALIAGGR